MRRSFARYALIMMTALTGGCTSTVTTTPYFHMSSVPGAQFTPRFRSPAPFFPSSVFDMRCSYSRTLRRGEDLAAYLTAIARPDGLLDLDCFIYGQPETPTREGQSPRYYYANTFLMVLNQEGRELENRSFSDILARTGLGVAPSSRETLYVLSGFAYYKGDYGCAFALLNRSMASAPHDELFWEGSQYWYRIEGRRSAVRGSINCEDPIILAILR